MALYTAPFYRPDSLTHTALIADDASLSYGQLYQRIEDLCVTFKARGIEPGERVAFMAPLTISTVIRLLALIHLGAVCCPLSPRLPSLQIDQAIAAVHPHHFLDHALSPLHKEPPYPLPLCTMLLTSGSSASPKIACHTLDNHIMSALGVIPSLKLNSNSLYHLCLPLFHVSGIAILFRVLLSGAAIALSFDAPFTHLSLVPTQLHRLIAHSPPPSLQCALIGGAPLPPTLAERAITNGWPIQESYGMTEMSSTITLQTLLPYRKLKIVNGEIFVGGKVLFQGYWNAHTRTVDSPFAEGWFATKDLGSLDAQGRLTIVGRKDRQFISGGENIQPEEIERALCSLPHIIRAKVVPKPDPLFGERPIAFIEDASSSYTLEAIQTLLTPLLPSFKHPIQLHHLTYKDFLIK